MNYLNELIYWLNKMKLYLELGDIPYEHKLIITQIEARLKELEPILTTQDEGDEDV